MSQYDVVVPKSRAAIRQYTGTQLRPGELLFALIVIGAADETGKHNLILRTIEEQVLELQQQPPIARTEVYQRLRQLVDEFAMFAETPTPPQFSGSTIAECETAVEKITGQKPFHTVPLDKL